MCDSIKRSSVISLDLRCNRIGERGVAAICELLAHYSLQKLNLNHNALHSATIAGMLPSIRKSTLVKFNVGQAAKINEDIMNEIEEILTIQKGILNRFKTTKSSNSSIATQ